MKPNIVYIHTHDLGRFCEPMGYNIPSPNLMRLAKQSVLFRQCHCSAPSCAPSRAALLTGQHPHSCGMLGLPSSELGYKLNDYTRHLAGFLRRNGYETALSGVQHVAQAPQAPFKEHLPYDHFLNHTPKGHQSFDPGLTAPAAVDFLLNREHNKPFFLSVGFLDPHRNNRDDNRIFIESQPMTEPADIEERAKYCQPWPHMPDNDITRREMANFKMGVEMMDSDVGKVLRALDAPQLRNNTFVIFTTDHGPGVCEMKSTLTDRGTGVIMMMRAPADKTYKQFENFTPGKVVDGMTQHLDIYPTLCELLDLEKPDWLDGKSLMPLLDNEKEIHDAIFTEQTYHYSADPRPFRAVRTPRYKYIRSYKQDQQRGIDAGPAQAFWTKYGYAKRMFDDEMLYDLYFDPQETNNLAKSQEHSQILNEMRERLHKWQSDTKDPLITGNIPIPPAQRSN